MTEPPSHYVPAEESTEGPMHPYLYHHWQNLDMPCRNMGTAYDPEIIINEKKKKKSLEDFTFSEQETLLFYNHSLLLSLHCCTLLIS